MATNWVNFSGAIGAVSLGAYGASKTVDEATAPWIVLLEPYIEPAGLIIGGLGVFVKAVDVWLRYRGRQKAN